MSTVAAFFLGAAAAFAVVCALLVLAACVAAGRADQQPQEADEVMRARERHRDDLYRSRQRRGFGGPQ